MGLWPAFAIDELKLFLKCAASDAEALVAYLVPFGEFYSRFCDDPRLSILKKEAWLPSASGGLVSICDAWLPQSDASLLERPFTFAPIVCKLQASWGFLGFRSSPSFKNIVDILRVQKSAEPAFVGSVQDWRYFYGHLAAKVKDLKEDLDENDETSRAMDFLRSESWVFVPDHPRLISAHRDAFDAKGESIQRRGRLYCLCDLVFRDECRLVDTYSKSVSDAASDFARAGCRKRVLGQYYWGPHTLFPPNWSGQRYTEVHADVQDLFLKLGVPQRLQWSTAEL